MSNQDLLDLFNECLSIVEDATDDGIAQRVLFVAVRLLQAADKDFARHCSDIDLPVTTPAPFGALRGSGSATTGAF